MSPTQIVIRSGSILRIIQRAERADSLGMAGGLG